MEMIEKTRKVPSFPEAFYKKMAERIPLWVSIIKDSPLSEELKDEYLAEIETLDSKAIYNEVTRDFPYSSIDILRATSEKAIKEYPEWKKDIVAIYGNLKDDIMASFKEIKKEII